MSQKNSKFNHCNYEYIFYQIWKVINVLKNLTALCNFLRRRLCSFKNLKTFFLNEQVVVV